MVLYIIITASTHLYLIEFNYLPLHHSKFNSILDEIKLKKIELKLNKSNLIDDLLNNLVDKLSLPIAKLNIIKTYLLNTQKQ